MRQIAMDVRDYNGAFADSRCYALDRFGSDITNSVDTRYARRERCGLKAKRSSGKNEPFLIELDRPVHPPGVRFRTDHDEDA